jgi:subtilisin family serine protease
MAALAVGAGPAGARAQSPSRAALSAAAPVVVAVVDSGVQADHPALAGRVLPGWNFVDGNGDTSDDNGHGTAVAGVVVAAEGSTGTGACSECRILPVKVLDSHAVGNWETVAAGIVWAADHGAQVINLSFGAPRVPDSLGSAVSYAVSKGAIVVAAAGNDGKDESFYPAGYPSVISVAGVDANETRYRWSNFGAHVTVAAPGCATAAWPGGGYLDDFCGTSTAAPFVAGLAALALSFRPGLTPAEFTGALADSGDPLPDPSTARSAANPTRLLAAVGIPAAVPTLLRSPALSSPALVGRTLAAASGSWQNATSFAYVWQRSRDGREWQPVATGATYTPRTADRGYLLRLAVSATNPRGRTTAVSAPTAPVDDTALQTKSVKRRRPR